MCKSKALLRLKGKFTDNTNSDDDKRQRISAHVGPVVFMPDEPKSYLLAGQTDVNYQLITILDGNIRHIKKTHKNLVQVGRGRISQ